MMMGMLGILAQVLLIAGWAFAIHERDLWFSTSYYACYAFVAVFPLVALMDNARHWLAEGDIPELGRREWMSVLVLPDLVRNGTDLAMGSRLRGKIEKGAMPFQRRYLGTPVFPLLIRILFPVNTSDCNCGMRAFSKASYARMGIRSGGMEFASEMICRAARAKMKVAEHPISLARDIRNRQPHLHTWCDGWRHLKLILREFLSRR